MDNKTAQDILTGYRANGEDARDPFFADALEQCTRDPELATWLERERAFDRSVNTALESIEVPADGKARLLEMAARMEKRQGEGAASSSDENDALIERRKPAFWRGHRWIRASLGLAAACILGLVLWQTLPMLQQPNFEPEKFSMGEFISRAMPLSYRNDDPVNVKAWLASRNAPTPEAFPGNLAEASALGCRIFELPQGGKISLICLLKNGEVVHYFVFDDAASELLAATPLKTWWTEDGWHLYSFNEGNQRIAVATQGNPHHIL